MSIYGNSIGQTGVSDQITDAIGALTADDIGALDTTTPKLVQLTTNSTNVAEGYVYSGRWQHMAIIEIRGLVLADSADGTYTSYVIASGIPTTRQTMRSASITVDGAVTGSSLKVAYGSGNLTIEVREKSLAGKMLYGQIIYYCERT